MSGPLRGLKVVEMAGIGPASFASCLLADMSAKVIRFEKPQMLHPGPERRFDVLARGRRTLAVDLHQSGSVEGDFGGGMLLAFGVMCALVEGTDACFASLSLCATDR